MMFGQLHVVEYPEENLKQVAPPVRPERIAVSLDDLKENSEGSSAHVQFAATHDTRELKQQREPAPHPSSVLFTCVSIL